MFSSAPRTRADSNCRMNTQAITAIQKASSAKAALLDGSIAWGHLGAAYALDALWMAVMAWLFMRQFEDARVRGALLNIGE